MDCHDGLEMGMGKARVIRALVGGFVFPVTQKRKGTRAITRTLDEGAFLGLRPVLIMFCSFLWFW